MKIKHTGWLRVLALIIPYLLIVGGFQFLGALVANIDISNPDYIKSSDQRLISSFFNLLGTFFLLWVFMKFVDKEKFINLGFHTKNRSLDFIIGIGIGILIMAGGFCLLLIMGEITFKEVVFNPQEVIISILIFLIVSIVEEVLFRGYILKNLMISFNKYIALVVSSIMFALLHGFNPNIDLFSLFGLFLAGLLLGISYIHTKNLWFPIALHFSWNFFQTHFGFNVSGLNVYSIIEINIADRNLLNGGAFGFEGSVLSIISEIVVIIGIGYYCSNTKLKTSAFLSKAK